MTSKEIDEAMAFFFGTNWGVAILVKELPEKFNEKFGTRFTMNTPIIKMINHVLKEFKKRQDD